MNSNSLLNYKAQQVPYPTPDSSVNLEIFTFNDGFQAITRKAFCSIVGVHEFHRPISGARKETLRRQGGASSTWLFGDVAIKDVIPQLPLTFQLEAANVLAWLNKNTLCFDKHTVGSREAYRNARAFEFRKYPDKFGDKPPSQPKAYSRFTAKTEFGKVATENGLMDYLSTPGPSVTDSTPRNNNVQEDVHVNSRENPYQAVKGKGQWSRSKHARHVVLVDDGGRACVLVECGKSGDTKIHGISVAGAFKAWVLFGKSPRLVWCGSLKSIRDIKSRAHKANKPAVQDFEDWAVRNNISIELFVTTDEAHTPEVEKPEDVASEKEEPEDMDGTPPNDDQEQEEAMSDETKATSIATVYKLPFKGTTLSIPAITDRNGRVLIHGVSATRPLDYVNDRQALGRISDPLKVTYGELLDLGLISPVVCQTDNSDFGRLQRNTVFLTAGGFSQLFYNSEKAGAEEYRVHIHGTIMESIFKTGGYSVHGKPPERELTFDEKLTLAEGRLKQLETNVIGAVAGVKVDVTSVKDEVAKQKQENADKFAELERKIAAPSAPRSAPSRFRQPRSISPDGFLTIAQIFAELKLPDPGEGIKGVLGKFLCFKGNSDSSKGNQTILTYKKSKSRESCRYRNDLWSFFQTHFTNFDGTWPERMQVFRKAWGDDTNQWLLRDRWILDEERKSKDRQRQYGFKFADAHV